MLFLFMILLPVADITLVKSSAVPYLGFSEDIDGHDVFVDTEAGKLRGRRRPANPNTVQTTGTERYAHVDWFLGVQYALPPVGSLRFRTPQPVKGWTGIRDSLRYSRICPQSRRGIWFDVIENQDEDCLYLNIYSPVATRSDDTELLAVMVYIHGGSYRVGTGAIFVGEMLALQGVVVVTLNYRLGILGFLSAGDLDLPGNYGLLDQIEALSWIQKNIRHFRGDPSRVTIFGNSAGGSSVGLLSASPKAKGLFQQTIAQSGSALSFWACHNTSVDFNRFFRQVAQVAGCGNNNSNNSGILDNNKDGISNGISNSSRRSMESKHQPSVEELTNCMRELKWQYFNTDEFEYSIPKISSEHTDFKPVVDGIVLPQTPRELFSPGASNYEDTTYDRCSLEGQGQGKGSAFHIKALMTGLIEDELTKHMGGLFLNTGFHEEDPSIDRVYNDGFDRRTFEKALRYVVGSCFGHDELISDIVISQYTNWSNCDDPFINRYKYVEFLTDMSMLTPTVELAGFASDADIPTYLYLLKLVDNDAEWTANHHEMELSYVFGGPYTGQEMETGGLKNFTAVQRRASSRLMRLWTNFAKYGNPNANSRDQGSNPSQTEEDIRWTTYRRYSPDYLRIQAEFSRPERDLKPDRVTLWSKLIPTAAARINKFKIGGVFGGQGEGERACMVGVIVVTACAVTVLMIFVIVIIVLVARDKRRNLR